MIRSRVPPVTWTVLGASAMTTLGTLPVFLLGSQSVFVRSELHFGDGRFGIAVSVFFATAAIGAFAGGSLVDRAGRRASTITAGLLAAVGGFGVAGLGLTWLLLVVGMAVLGLANAACQMTSNLLMARAVPPHRRGLGFGVKQAAIPLSIMLAGLAVPTVAVGVGWRWTFAFVGLGGVVIAVSAIRLPHGRQRREETQAARDKPSRPALLTTMVATMFASAAANSLGSFAALWGFRVGLTPSQAGLIMAAGSAANVTVRIIAGHLADRRHGRNLPVVATQMLIGAAALAAMSFPVEPTVIVAQLVAFALGWSWPGLLLYAVVRVGRDFPSAASGYVQAGAFVGGASGPVLFGAVVGAAGFETAWRLAAVAFVAAAVLALVARRIFIADLIARPPSAAIGYGGGRANPARQSGPGPER